MIGGLLLVLLGLAGAMQAPLWAVPLLALLIAVLCGGVPFLRGRLTGPAAWVAILALSAIAYAVGYGAGVGLIG
jgi:hypothetical protein